MFASKPTCFLILLLQLVQVSAQSSFIKLPEVEEKMFDFYAIESFLEKQSFINIFHLTDEFDTKADEIMKKILQQGSLTSSRTFTLNSDDVKSTLNIILIDSLERLPVTSILDSKKVYLIILTPDEPSENNFQKCFQMFREKNILDVYIAFKSEESLSIATFQIFSHEKCYDSATVIIKNLSSLGLQKKHLTNFFECQLRFGVYVNIPYVMCLDHFPCEFSDLIGRDVELMKTLSKALNFSMEEKIFKIDETKKSFSSLTNNQSDIIIGDLFLKKDRIEKFDASVSYISSDLTFVVPKGEPFTPLERLAKPFRSFVWLTLLATLLIALLVIIGIKFQAADVQTFVFGNQNNIPTLNMVAIIFGVSQHRLPSRNFARFILMNFILFALIMRSLYQGSVYRFLQSKLSHEAAETIEEMINENFDFYLYEANIDILDTEHVDKSKVKIFSLANLEGFMKNISNYSESSHKAAFCYSRSMFLYLLNNFNYDCEISKETIVNVPIVLYFQKGSIFADTFDVKLGQIMSSGLIEFWQKQPLKNVPKYPVAERKVLTIEHFSGTFQIWLVGCLITILTFTIEVLSVKCR